jgi:hypothetical protein
MPQIRIKEWLKSPPADMWEAWRNRWDAWMVALVQAVNTLYTWGDATTFSTTLTQSNAVTHTTNEAQYQRVGDWVFGVVYITATGSGTASNIVTAGLPVARAAAFNMAIGSGYFVDASSGIVYPVVVYASGSTTATFIRSANESTSPYLGLSGFTAAIATGDVLSFHFAYRVG